MKNLGLSWKKSIIVTGRVIFVLMLLLSACRKDSNPPEASSKEGDIISERLINTWDTTEIRSIVNALNVDLPGSLHSDVEVYSITYYTTDPSGDLVPATGALFIPEYASAMPLMSIQHGTETKKSMVSSVNPLVTTGEGYVGLIAGSLDFITCIPDYLGLGGSDGLHPYLYAKTLSDNVIDFLVASQHSLTQKEVGTTGELYLTGYSEGGYVTMAVHKSLEEQLSPPFHVTASIPMAGSYDLKLTVDTVLARASYANPTIIAYFLLAYNDIYHWNRLDEIFNAPYATTVPQLFDGFQTTAQIMDQLPQTISQLLKEDFIAGYLDGTDQPLINAIEENSLLGWGPVAPMHLIHGTADSIVPYQNMVRAKEDLTNHGGVDITTRSIPGGSHTGSAVAAFTNMFEWVDSLRNAK